MFKDMTGNSLVEQAVCYILGLGDGDLAALKVKNLARELGVNQAYLSYLFRDDQNMTIPQFIEREIIYRALFRLQEDFEVSIDHLAKLFGFAHVSDSIIFFDSLSLLVSRPPGVYEGISGGRLARLSPLSPRWHMICSFIFYLPLILSNDQAVPGLVLPKNSPSPADWPGRLFFIYFIKNAFGRDGDARVWSEAARVWNEPARVCNEPALVWNEPAPVWSEAAPVWSEAARVWSEAARVCNEPARVWSEPARVCNEPARVWSEAARVWSEAARVCNEPARVWSEHARICNEPARVWNEPAPLCKQNVRYVTHKKINKGE